MVQVNNSVHLIPRENEKLIGKLVCESTKRYFENKEHRQAFEKWYLEKYGVAYEWKTI